VVAGSEPVECVFASPQLINQGAEMKTVAISFLILLTSLLVGHAHAQEQEQKLKISMEILLGGKVIATPGLVSQNAKRSTIQIGNRSAEPAHKKHNELNIEIIPTLEGDDQVIVVFNIKVMNEQLVDQKPVKNGRQLSATAKLSLGKQGSISVLPNAEDEPVVLNIKVDKI
jgi:hypothetical protein